MANQILPRYCLQFNHLLKRFLEVQNTDESKPHAPHNRLLFGKIMWYTKKAGQRQLCQWQFKNAGFWPLNFVGF
ncbi:hypothetical protein, partial [Oscillibacter sp.]|uniref:hypothetical protein n=1 Tax=Oscillibacter sp. TaxID=1945593 RepID=UPI00289B4D3E